MYDLIQRLPDQLDGLAKVYDINPLLTEMDPHWQRRLGGIALRHAQPKTHTGIDDKYSCMQPGDPPIIAYRVLPSVVEQDYPEFNDLMRSPILLDLAEEAFDEKLVGAGDEDSLYDFNVAMRPPNGEPLPNGEKHYDSIHVGLFPYAAFDNKSVRTEFTVGDKNRILRLSIGQIAFFRGYLYPHKALYGSDPAFHSGDGDLRGTISPGFWLPEGPGAFDPVQRAEIKAILYDSDVDIKSGRSVQ